GFRARAVTIELLFHAQHEVPHRGIDPFVLFTQSLQDPAMGYFMLGMEKKFDGDRTGAKAALEAALATPHLPEEYRQQVQRAIADL
ncbi:MAG: hypothetical protein AAFN74_24500, partial [Myxococcota bacterium]